MVPTVEMIEVGLSDELRDAWFKMKDFNLSLAHEQRIYASTKSVMFATDRCYSFLRPKKKYIELCFFLHHKLDEKDIKIQQSSAHKYTHTLRLVHSDQVEEPLTSWIEESFLHSIKM